MAGPTRQTTNTVIIPPGEGRRSYSPVSLAWYVENLEVENGDALRSIVGPSILRIKSNVEREVSPPPYRQGTNYPDADIGSRTFPNFGFKGGARPHSIFSANLLNGSAHTLLYRFGTTLYRFLGGEDSRDETLVTTLSTSKNPRFPDQYVQLGNNIVWTNGEDRARVIQFNGNVFELGYQHSAETPLISGPTQPDFDEIPQYYPNSVGYSWPGRIGTPGDVLSGRDGSLLNGAWYYYFQYEDLLGNLSAFSSPSEPASIHSNQAEPFVSVEPDGTPKYMADSSYGGTKIQAAQGTEIDDLTRRFLVRCGGEAPEQTVAIRIYRTPDTKHVDNTPRFLARIPGSSAFAHDDNKSDSELGLEWVETIDTPVFRVACSHQGRLIAANIVGDPGAIRQSFPSLPGTFAKSDILHPDSGGAEVTGTVSHNGVLLAFTENATYSISQDFKLAQPLSLGIGCVAPRSISALPDGTLMWLGRDGFYGMKNLGDIVRMSSPIDKAFSLDVNPSRMHMAVATIDSESKEYRCALAPSGHSQNRLMFCFDGKYWRRQTLGIHIADMCSSKDWRGYTFAIGSDPRETNVAYNTELGSPTTPSDAYVTDLHRVFVLGRQTTDYFGPPRRIRYRSSWIMAAENGLVPTNVRMLYVGLKDAWNGDATVRIYKNGSWKPIEELTDLRLVGPDDGSGVVVDVASNATYGSSKVHTPRLFWRQVPVDLHNVTSWAFEIELIGWPGPLPFAQDLDRGKDMSAFASLFPSSKDGAMLAHEIYDSTDRELGRLRLSAFAFDTSVATLGAPLGRVPKRRDK